MTEPTLHDVLARATDEIESPELAATAIAGAHQRRLRRRGAFAAVGSAIAVASVIAVVALVDASETSEPAPGVPTPTNTEDAPRRWDPRHVDDLPAAAPQVAPGLPDVVAPPSSAPPLAGQPVPAAVLSARGPEHLMLLATDGSWRSVPLPSNYGGAELTRDGTRLVVVMNDGVVVWDLATGARTDLPNPPGYAAWDFTSWRWIDRSTLLLDDGSPGGWLVDARTGDAERVPYPSRTASPWVVDRAGAVVESADWTYPAMLTDWAGGEPRRVDLSAVGRPTTFRVDEDTVVGTSYENGPFSVYVVDRSDLTRRAVLRLRDPEANYSNGGLTVAGLLADGTVLLRVAVFEDEMSWRLVAWDPGSGDLSLVTRGVAVVLSFADDLVGGVP